MLIMLVSGVLVAKLSGLWPETQKVLSRNISQPHAGKKSARKLKNHLLIAKIGLREAYFGFGLGIRIGLSKFRNV